MLPTESFSKIGNGQRAIGTRHKTTNKAEEKRAGKYT